MIVVAVELRNGGCCKVCFRTHLSSPPLPVCVQALAQRLQGLVSSLSPRSGTSVRLAHRFVSLVGYRLCSDSSLTFASERSSNLEALSIKSCPNVTNASMAQIAYKCSKLRELDISFCYEISHKSLVMIGRNCPNIRVLKRNLRIQKAGNVPMEYLNACPVDGDLEASGIAKFMPNLEHLELQFGKLSGKGLVLIFDGCLNLQYLDLYGCENLRSRDAANAIANLKNLKEFKSPNMYIPSSSYNAERYAKEGKVVAARWEFTCRNGRSNGKTRFRFKHQHPFRSISIAIDLSFRFY